MNTTKTGERPVASTAVVSPRVAALQQRSEELAAASQQAYAAMQAAETARDNTTTGLN